jgi:hypothetical protein
MGKRLLMVMLLICMVALTAGSALALEGWSNLNLKHSINDTTSLKMEFETRTNDKWNYRYEHTDFGIFYVANSWLELAANYRVLQHNWKAYSVTRNSGYVSAPHINANIFGQVSGIKLSNNFRLMYDTGADILIWENTSGALFPVEMNNGSTLIPYVKVRPYIGLSSRGLFQFRSYFGVDYKFADSKWIVPGVCYINEFRNIDKTSALNYNAIVLNLTFNVQ